MSAADARALDDDLPPLMDALAARGIAHRVVDWDDPGADWATHRLVVVRSPWDYTRRHAEFMAWAERVAGLTTLENPPPVLRWSADKHYMRDLARAGVPVVATAFAAPGEAMDWPGPGEMVVKPTISAGSLDTARYPAGRRAEATAHVARLHAQGRVAMAQPYLSRVEGERGETALVFVDGVFSHAAAQGADAGARSQRGGRPLRRGGHPAGHRHRARAGGRRRRPRGDPRRSPAPLRPG